MMIFHYNDTPSPVGNPVIMDGNESAYELGIADGADYGDQYADEPEATIGFESPECAREWLAAVTAILTPYIETGDRAARIPDPTGWAVSEDPSPVEAAMPAADAVLAHLAERRAGDVEAVAKVLAEHLPIDDAWDECSCGWDGEVDGWLPQRRAAFARHQAAQIAALPEECHACQAGIPLDDSTHAHMHRTPTRGVSAEQVEAAEEAVRGYSSSVALQGGITAGLAECITASVIRALKIEVLP